VENKKFGFGYGNTVMEVELPEKRILHEIEGCPAAAIEDVPAAVRAALRNPIGTPPLKEVVKAGETVAIVVSDITRAWIKANQFCQLYWMNLTKQESRIRIYSSW